MTNEEQLQRLLQETSDLLEKERRDNRQNQLQRRNQVSDLYGIPFNAQGDTNSPATVYLSITPDMVYLERFEFKLIVNKFAMPIQGHGTVSAKADLAPTDLTINNGSIVPNPHTHEDLGHTHNLVPGIALFDSQVEDFEVWVEGIDVTQQLKAQYPGRWIDGEGVFPSTNLKENYDLIKAAGSLNRFDRAVVTGPGFKKIELKAKGIFNVTLMGYTKPSVVNR